MTAIYDIDRLDNGSPVRTIVLEISEAAIDWGYEAEEAKRPEDVPYFCELTVTWCAEAVHDYVAVSTNGFIYPKADGKRFKCWDLASFVIDPQLNGDSYGLAENQDNQQGFLFRCSVGYDNHKDISQAAADKLEAIASDLGSHTVNIEYPTCIIELIGLEP